MSIYMRQPDGFIDPAKPHHVCKLNQALYGLKQAGRVWNEKVNKVVSEFKMRRSEHDPCVYYKFHENTDWLIVLLFVDDFFITGSHNLIEQFTNHLKNCSIRLCDPVMKKFAKVYLKSKTFNFLFYFILFYFILLF
jgi:hypothetical protein